MSDPRERFQPVEVIVSCGCVTTMKRWERDRWGNPGNAYGCHIHGLTTVSDTQPKG